VHAHKRAVGNSDTTARLKTREKRVLLSAGRRRERERIQIKRLRGFCCACHLGNQSRDGFVIDSQGMEEIGSKRSGRADRYETPLLQSIIAMIFFRESCSPLDDFEPAAIQPFD
jgi:hypothetical protein